MLDKYSLINSSEFEIEMIGDDTYKYDIIFGDYDSLANLEKKN